MKRLLALDGGGIRGVFSLEMLARIEQLLREKTGNPNLVLADHFHYLGGTSTGAIIATCLSWGMSVAEVHELYTNRAIEMFRLAPIYLRFWSKFEAAAITRMFKVLFSEDGGRKNPGAFEYKEIAHPSYARHAQSLRPGRPGRSRTIRRRSSTIRRCPSAI